MLSISTVAPSHGVPTATMGKAAHSKPGSTPASGPMRSMIRPTAGMSFDAAMARTCCSIERQIASSCIGRVERGADVVEQLPGGLCVCGADRLQRVADMDEHVVADRNILIRQQCQAHVAANAPGLAVCHVTTETENPHRNSEAHAPVSVSGNGPEGRLIASGTMGAASELYSVPSNRGWQPPSRGGHMPLQFILEIARRMVGRGLRPLPAFSGCRFELIFLGLCFGQAASELGLGLSARGIGSLVEVSDLLSRRREPRR